MIRSLENEGAHFLAENQLADCYLADAIRALAFDADADPSEQQFIDYSSLGVRHLGDVYEGLLEHCLHKDSPEEPITLVESSQRKKSGSYFTPHFIVEFIVAKAVGPVLEIRLKEVESELAQWNKVCKSRERARTTPSIKTVQKLIDALSHSIFDRLFGLKVLDPTMGSGHFLVNAVDYLTDRIVIFLVQHPNNPVLPSIQRMRNAILADLQSQGINEREIERISEKLTEINLIKRMVMKRCIYGVDLNPMAVELAKLSLWLDSFTLGAPLSFLDHHLKLGNTVIGTTVESVQRELAADLFGNRFAGMLQATELIREVGELTDATMAEVQESEAKFDHARKEIAPFLQLMDTWQAELFGHIGALKALHHADGDKQTIKRGKQRIETGALIHDIQRTATEHRFFHWELEFPEVWYGGGHHLDQPGFDAVIGNPPWVRQGTFATLKKVLESAFPTVYMGVADIYVYVLMRGLNVLKSGGRLGFIILNKWLRSNYGELLRKELATQYHPELLVDFGHASLFADAETFPLIALIRRPHPDDTPEPKTLRVCKVSREALDNLKLAAFVEKKSFEVPTNYLKTVGWYLEPPDVLRLFEKIRCSGVLLKEFVGDGTYRGLLTGLNEAFFLDQATRDKLVAEAPKCEELMKKLLRGRNIQRWVAQWDKEWLIAIPSSQNRAWPWATMTDDEAMAEEMFAKEFPAMHAHLKPMERALRKREDRGKFWWELRACDYYEKLEEPKLIYQEIQTYSSFALDNNSYYINNKAFLIPSGDLYILALLNSPLMWWFLSIYLPHMINDTLTPVAFLMEKCPVVSPPQDIRESIEARVRECIQVAQDFAGMRSKFLQWVLHETGIIKVPPSVETPWRLQVDEFLAALKKAGLKRISPAMLQHLTQTFEKEKMALSANRMEALRLERELDVLILDNYGLTPEDIALLRKTAPPRSPITVLEEGLYSTPAFAENVQGDQFYRS